MAATAHNPVRMLRTIGAERARSAAADDPEFLGSTTTRIAGLDAARAAARTRGGATTARDCTATAIAYFSAEFALHQSLPIYAGGLGVLAGDHCKEASDLGVPLVGVGFMYPQGYFHQRMLDDGWQEESYERINWTDAPIEPAITPDGKPCITAVPLGDRTVLVAVWRVRVGRVRLTCSTPTSRRTRRGTASCRRGSTAATARRASSRRSSSASAASARCGRWASSRRSAT